MQLRSRQADIAPKRGDDADTDVLTAVEEPEDRSGSGAWERWVSRVPASPYAVLVYAGVALMALAFGLIAYTWGKVAGLVAVPLQLPYLASGGLLAIALAVLGGTLVALAAGRRDAARREELLEEIVHVLRSIRETVDSQDDAR